MERILSNEQCNNLLLSVKDKLWERVDRFGKYDQVFISDEEVKNTVLSFFNKDLAAPPILKVIKLSKGDNIPTFSADYSNKEDEYFKRYIDTNFIIQIYLNDNFEGGVLSKAGTPLSPKAGYGIIQNKTDKCSLSAVSKGEAYFLFIFISKLKTSSLL